MRITAFILAILVFVLSCLPCADTDAEPLGYVKTEASKTTDGQHKTEHRDLCSPFCHCACCATYCVIKIPFSLPVTVEVVTPRVYTMYFSDEVYDISLPVWQPPQLV